MRIHRCTNGGERGRFAAFVRLGLAGGVLLLSPVLRAAGFPNEAQTPGALLSGVNGDRMGRTAMIAYHNGILYTVPEGPDSYPGSDFLIRSWDLNAGRGPGGWFPQELGAHFVTSEPGQSHAYYSKGDFLYLGESTPQPWTNGRQVFRATNQFGVNVIETMSNTDSTVNPVFLPGFNRQTQQNFRGPDGAARGTPIRAMGSMFYPWFTGANYTAYNFTAVPSYAYAPTGLARPGEPGFATWDHIAMTNPGVVGRPYLMGNLLYFLSDQAMTGAGVAAYDLNGLWQNDPDPALAYKPRLLGVMADPQRQIGGYFPELFGMDGRLYAVFPTEILVPGLPGQESLRVVDVTDPSNMVYVSSVALPNSSRAQYVQFQDESAFIAGYKVNMRNLITGVGNPITLFFNPDNVNRLDPVAQRFTPSPHIDVSQFALPLGNLLVTGGIDANWKGASQGMAIWAHQAAPDTRPPSVSYHNPAANQTNYPTRAPLGFLIHETLNTSTIRVGDTFIVRPVGGAALDGDWVYLYNDILSFTPGVKTTNPDGTISWTYVPLQDDTTYEVIFRDIEDAAGNRMPEYRFTFSTGNSLQAPPAITALAVSPVPAAPNQDVTITATASNATEYQFDFGDGSPRTAWGAADAVTHQYAAPNLYTVTAWARNATGVAVSRLTQATVINPPPAGSPRNSGTMALGANRLLWTVNPDNDSVTAINADTLVRQFEVAVGRDPRNLAIDPSGRLWVTCFDAGEVRVLNGTNGSLIQTINTGRGSQPFGVVFHPARAEAYVSLHGTGRLAAYNSADFSSLGSVALGPTPRALGLNNDGSRLYVTRFISPAGRGEVWELNTSPLALANTIALPRFSEPDGQSSGSGVPNSLSSIALMPDGARAWVTSTKANTGTAAIDPDNTVRNVATLLDLSVRTVAGSIDIDNSDSASAAALSPHGVYLMVANQGTNEVMVFRSSLFSLGDAAGNGRLVGRFSAGLAPQGILVDPVTRRTFAGNFMSRTITALETAGLFNDGNASVTQSQVNAVASDALGPQVLQGKRIFYNAADPRMSSEGYLSCATCHTDGGHDGRVWDFTARGEGLRRTISLRGRAGTGHGRVHWSANFDEIQDFEHDIRSAFRGTGFMSDAAFNAGTRNQTLGDPKAGLSADLDALAAYVSSLSAADPSPFRTAGGALTPEAQAGKLIFQRQNCAVCHAGNAFTDSPTALLHDVGTIKPTSGERLGAELLGLDTPTLKGLWENASYLHDGSAATITDVLTAPNNAQHGRMDQLTPQERSELAAFLLQIDDGETQPSSPPALVLAPLAPAGGDRYGVTVTTGLPMSQVDLVVDGQLAGQALLRPDGSYFLTVTLPDGWVSLEVYGTHEDGGLTLAAVLNTASLNASSAPPGLKEAYAYPNPAVGQDPVIQAFLGEGVDQVEITLFDQSGHAVHAGRVTQSAQVNGRTAFEYRWTDEKASGVYYAVIHGRKGEETVRARVKFAVVR